MFVRAYLFFFRRDKPVFMKYSAQGNDDEKIIVFFYPTLNTFTYSVMYHAVFFLVVNMSNDRMLDQNLIRFVTCFSTLFKWFNEIEKTYGARSNGRRDERVVLGL